MRRGAFGAGCFWGTEKYFRKEFGSAISNVAVGYMGGEKPNPTYEDVCTGTTGHAEVIYFEYNPEAVQYEALVEFFFRMHDPTTKNAQGNDRGTQYRSVVFYYDNEQLEKATGVMNKLVAANKFGAPPVTTFEQGKEFYKAEDYHQLYLGKNPGGYCNHRLRW
eukprot:PhF_6_TR23997/c0_g1_i2/m.33604/K07304/msrA; peptide-methionine (S)-S-oxide reductase